MLVIAFIVLVIVIVKTMNPKKTMWQKKTNRSSASEPECSHVHISRVYSVFTQMEAQAQEGSFAVFVFSSSDRPAPNDAVNLQFSVENSHAGFDWLLRTPRNIEDRSRFVQLAESMNYTVDQRQNNGVQSLRVEGNNLPQLCVAIMQELYGLNLDDKVYLYTMGFDWQE